VGRGVHGEILSLQARPKGLEKADERSSLRDFMRRDNRMPFGRRQILGVVVAAAVAMLGTEVGASGRKGRLKIAVCKEGYAPFVFQGADGKWQGYEMEVFSGLFDHIRTEAYFTRNDTVIDWIGDVPPEVFPISFPTKEEAGVALASMPGGAPPELTKLLNNSRGAMDNLIVAAWANHTDILMCGYQVQDYRTRAADFAIYFSVHTGYVVTVPSKADGETIPVTDVLALTITSPRPTAVLALLLLAIFSIVYAHFMWILERSENVGIRSEYGPGVFDAWWLAIITATTVGEHFHENERTAQMLAFDSKTDAASMKNSKVMRMMSERETRSTKKRVSCLTTPT
jgi:hypothetical protein